MKKVIGVTALQRNFRAILDEVVRNKPPHILTRASRPEAVLISYEEFLKFQQLQESEVLARFDRLLAKIARINEPLSEEEIQADLEAASQEMRLAN